jgi:prepilin-type N-terminal cleavage/methylation domain-containing protein
MSLVIKQFLNKQKGFTLIEVLLALSVMSISVLGSLAVYNSINSTITSQVKVTGVLQDARLTLQKLAIDIRKAGFQDPNKLNLDTPVAISMSTNLLTNLTTPPTPNTNLDIVSTNIPSQTLIENNDVNTQIVNLSLYFTDDNTLSYRVVNELDYYFFTICNSTWLCSTISFDYEQPSDNGADNVFDVQVAATDGVHQKNTTVQVTLQDLTPG